jgi:hypothetical protein
MTIIQKGGTCFLQTPFVVNKLDPLNGLKAADLTPDCFGNVIQRVNLSNMSGYAFVPSQATKFRVSCHLFRGVVPAAAAGGSPPTATGGGSIDGTDVSCCAFLNPTFALPNFGTETTAAAVGKNTEKMGQTREFPNVADSAGWGSFSWQIRGTTPIGAAVQLELVSFDVPDSYVLPAIYPVRNPDPSSLMMYFGGDGYADASPIGHTVVAHNSSIGPDGGAIFNGTSSYLSLAGDPSLNFSGDFTIEMTIATTTKYNGGGNQIRLLSFGNLPSIGIGIDPSVGAIALFNEYNAQLKVGGVSVCTGRQTTVKWKRESGINSLIINGQQDGPSFTDTTAWSAAAQAEIGRLCGQNTGMFVGEIFNLNIVKGLVI